jgi:hypothetical protein
LEQDNSHQTWQSFGEIAQLVDQADDSEARVKLEDELALINTLAKALYMKTGDMMKTIADSEGMATPELFSKTIIASIIGCDAGRRLNSLAMFMSGAYERPGGNA